MNSLKSERARAHLSVKEIAELLEVSEATVRRYEEDAGPMRLRDAGRLADAFGCSIDYLVGRTDERTVKQY